MREGGGRRREIFEFAGDCFDGDFDAATQFTEEHDMPIAQTPLEDEAVAVIVARTAWNIPLLEGGDGDSIGDAAQRAPRITDPRNENLGAWDQANGGAGILGGNEADGMHADRIRDQFVVHPSPSLPYAFGAIVAHG